MERGSNVLFELKYDKGSPDVETITSVVHRVRMVAYNLYHQIIIYYCYYYYFVRTQSWYNKPKMNIQIKKAILIINVCLSDRVIKCL